MSNVIPKFNFSQASIKTDEELKTALSGERGNDKYFRPGKYDVTIASVEYQGPAKDTNWGKFLLTLKGTGEKSIRAQVIVPFRDQKYIGASGKPTMLMFLRFTQFMTALGHTVTLDNLEETLTSVFANPERTLTGKVLGVEIGYDNNHIAYRGKDEIGVKKYVIQMKDGSVLSDASGKEITFPDIDSAKARAEQNQINLQEYVNVLSYHTSAANSKVGGAW
jgi:hypothetical protein